MNKYLLLLMLCLPAFVYGQDGIFGKWKTIDDETGKEKSIIEIYSKDGKAYGKIIELLNPSEENPKCDECDDDRKDQPILGMEILRALEKDGEAWDDGTIVDPENGKIYDCKIWQDGNDLKVRGYVAFFYRTQTWVRAE